MKAIFSTDDYNFKHEIEHADDEKIDKFLQDLYYKTEKYIDLTWEESDTDGDGNHYFFKNLHIQIGSDFQNFHEWWYDMEIRQKTESDGHYSSMNHN